MSISIERSNNTFTPGFNFKALQNRWKEVRDLFSEEINQSLLPSSQETPERNHLDPRVPLSV